MLRESATLLDFDGRLMSLRKDLKHPKLFSDELSLSQVTSTRSSNSREAEYSRENALPPAICGFRDAGMTFGETLDPVKKTEEKLLNNDPVARRTPYQVSAPKYSVAHHMVTTALELPGFKVTRKSGNRARHSRTFTKCYREHRRRVTNPGRRKYHRME